MTKYDKTYLGFVCGVVFAVLSYLIMTVVIPFGFYARLSVVLQRIFAGYLIAISSSKMKSISRGIFISLIFTITGVVLVLPMILENPFTYLTLEIFVLTSQAVVFGALMGFIIDKYGWKERVEEEEEEPEIIDFLQR